MTTESILDLAVLAVTMSSIWLVFVLSIRNVVSRWLGARWAYYLWLVPLLGLLATGIPTQPVQHMLDVPGIEMPAVNNMIESAAELVGLVDPPIAVESRQVSDSSRFRLSELLLFVWVLGACLSLFYFAARSFQFSKKMLCSSRALTSRQQSLVLKRCASLAKQYSGAIRMLSSGRGPAVAGLVQPVLLLPVDFFERYTTQQQVLMLEHEYQHLRRHDLIWLLLARVYRCLFWINPLVYVAEWYLQLDQELSCDEKVLSTENRTIRLAYGETLLLSAHTKLLFPQVSYSPSFGQIKRRTYMLKHHNRHIFGSLFGGLLLVVSVGTSVAYGVLGALEFEPDLEIREELRLPLTESLMVLETGDISDTTLNAMLGELERHETVFQEHPLSDNELAQLSNLLALIYSRMGKYDHSLAKYRQVVSLTDRMPEQQAQALYSIGEIQFAQGNYVETLQALMQLEDISPARPSSEVWALRSQAFVKLKRWDQGLRYINLAINQAEADGHIPQEKWLLSQTSLKWTLGDLAGAARSLERSIEIFPETTYKQTLVVFNELVQESWEPLPIEEALAQF